MSDVPTPTPVIAPVPALEEPKKPFATHQKVSNVMAATAVATLLGTVSVQVFHYTPSVVELGAVETLLVWLVGSTTGNAE